jgi:hypothetical protein
MRSNRRALFSTGPPNTPPRLLLLRLLPLRAAGLQRLASSSRWGTQPDAA